MPATRHEHRSWRRALGVIALALAAASAAAQPAPTTGWELRACAPPQTLPFSHDDLMGFENRIAAIVADQLGAQLTYEWVTFTTDLVNLYFAEGLCDVILGVPDGFERGLNTVAYYQSPYVMVYRADAGFDIDSLDDPDLASLRLGVQGAGTPPQAALALRGLNGNIQLVVGGSAGSDDRLAAMVRAVEDGRVDVGFGWGPAIAYYAARSEQELVVRPVSPEFEPPSIFQSIPMTMAVRRDDTDLRDLLNRAIAERWDDIQQVLADYQVPLTPIPPPFVGEPVPNPARVLVDVGVVLPVPTGGQTREAAINDLIGEAALRGALFAEGQVNAEEAATGTDVVLLLASAPSPEAAARAGQRLLASHELSALVGGVGAGQAEILATIAAEHGVPFLNVGSSEASPRRLCLPTSFHLEPAPGAYFSAMIDLYGPLAEDAVATTGAAGVTAGAQVAPAGAAPWGSGRELAWYVVHVDDDEGRAMLDSAAEAIRAAGDVLAGSTGVDPEAPAFFAEFDAIAAAGASAVMVVLPAPAQLTFMGQYQDSGGAALLAPYPDPVTQTRNYLAASLGYGVGVGLPRLVTWETTLADGKAAQLNARFTSRWGQPLDPTAWTAYEAVRVLAQAATEAGSAAPEQLLERLGSGAPFDTSKGSLSFGEDQGLRQQLYAVMADPDARWGVTLNQKLAIARLYRTLSSPDLPAAGACGH